MAGRVVLRVLQGGRGKALGHGDGVHGAGTGAADAIEAEIAVLQQGIEHAPGKGAVRAAALQGQADGGSFRHAVASSLLACHHHATSGGRRVTFRWRGS